MQRPDERPVLLHLAVVATVYVGATDIAGVGRQTGDRRDRLHTTTSACFGLKRVGQMAGRDLRELLQYERHGVVHILRFSAKW